MTHVSDHPQKKKPPVLQAPEAFGWFEIVSHRQNQMPIRAEVIPIIATTKAGKQGAISRSIGPFRRPNDASPTPY
jgi:hypothetical protein